MRSQAVQGRQDWMVRLKVTDERLSDHNTRSCFLCEVFVVNIPTRLSSVRGFEGRGRLASFSIKRKGP